MKNKKLYTEEDYIKSLKNTRILLIGGIIFSFLGGILGLIMEAFVYKYANRAIKSNNPQIVNKALNYKKIANIYWILIILSSLFWIFYLIIN